MAMDQTMIDAISFMPSMSIARTPMACRERETLAASRGTTSSR